MRERGERIERDRDREQRARGTDRQTPHTHTHTHTHTHKQLTLLARAEDLLEGLQLGITPDAVWLQVPALRPLIPCIHGHHAPGTVTRGRGIGNVTRKRLKLRRNLRRRGLEDGRAGVAPVVVGVAGNRARARVPAGREAERERGGGACKRTSSKQNNGIRQQKVSLSPSLSLPWCIWGRAQRRDHPVCCSRITSRTMKMKFDNRKTTTQTHIQIRRQTQKYTETHLHG
jgi:hypothetical protein